MKGIRVARSERERLRLVELAEPILAPGEILVRVEAASVSRLDVEMLDGWLGRDDDWAVPGCDAVGIIVGTNGSIGSLRIGDRVATIARPAAIGSGTYAEFLSVPAVQVVVVPDNLDAVIAAALPLAGLAASQALYALMPELGETILIHGASGGVGTLAIQLAKRLGVRVIATASAAAAPLCEALGADLVVDSRPGEVINALRRRLPGGCDALLDLVDHDTQPDSAAMLARRGRMVTLISVVNHVTLTDRRITAWKVDMRPDRTVLRDLMTLASQGKLLPVIAAILPLAEAGGAHALLRQGGVQGKLILRVCEPTA